MTQEKLKPIDAGEVQFGKLLTAEYGTDEPHFLGYVVLVKETVVEQRHAELTKEAHGQVGAELTWH